MMIVIMMISIGLLIAILCYVKQMLNEYKSIQYDIKILRDLIIKTGETCGNLHSLGEKFNRMCSDLQDEMENEKEQDDKEG